VIHVSTIFDSTISKVIGKLTYFLWIKIIYLGHLK